MILFYSVASPYERMKWVWNRTTWRPDDWAPTTDPHIQKMVAAPVFHLKLKVGCGTVMLKPHTFINNKG
jgi:hypothetical protein